MRPFLTLTCRSGYARLRMRRTLRSFLIALLILAALVALAYQSRHKVHLADFTWRKFAHSVSGANVWLLLISFIGIYVCYAIRALRWQRFCRYLGPTGFWSTYSATLMGFAAIFVLGRAGEPVRPLLLARKNCQPAPGMFGIFFLERAIDFASAAALACLSLLVFPKALSDAGADTDWLEGARRGAWLLLGGLVALVAFLFYYRVHGAGAVDRFLVRWRSSSGMRRRLASALTGISEGLQAIRTWPDLLLAVAYSAAHWGLAAAIYWAVAQAFAADFPTSNIKYPGAMLLLAVTLVGSVLNLPGLGGGAQFASFIGLTRIFNVDQEPAAAIAVVLWLITFAGSAVAGVPLLIHEGLSMGELRKLARAEAQAEEIGAHVTLNGANGNNGNLAFKGKERGESSR